MFLLCLSAGYFAGQPADFLFMLLFNAICIDVSYSVKLMFCLMAGENLSNKKIIQSNFL